MQFIHSFSESREQSSEISTSISNSKLRIYILNTVLRYPLIIGGKKEEGNKRKRKTLNVAEWRRVWTYNEHSKIRFCRICQIRRNLH